MIKPLWANVLMKRDKLKSKNIIIPSEYEKANAPRRGVVVATGPSCAGLIETGKMYLHGEHAGTWINAEGRIVAADDGEFYLLNEEDLIAEVEGV